MMNTNFVRRAPRYQHRPDRLRSFVKFDEGAAQFADISTTGMRLFSRAPSRAEAGDVLNLEFSLPGSSTVFRTQAMVVRRQNDFDFAVKFLDWKVRQVLERALKSYAQLLEDHGWRVVTANLQAWAGAHAKGLAIAACGIAFATAVGAYIYAGSDEHLGNSLRSWGRTAPKSMYLDYVDKFKN